MPKFVHIDIAADDPDRAAAFYREAFGWVVTKLPGPVPYQLVATDPDDPAALGAGIGKREQAGQHTVPTIEVDSADDYTKKIEAAGGTITQPKQFMPGVGNLVGFRDTEGNDFAILEPSADNPFSTD